MDAAPSALSFFPLPHDAFNQHPTRKELFYGLANGNIGQLFLDPTSHHRGTVLGNAGGKGAVTQLFSAFDMTQNGMNEIAVGRDDGSFEIYDMSSTGELRMVRLPGCIVRHHCQTAHTGHASVQHGSLPRIAGVAGQHSAEHLQYPRRECDELAA